MHLCLAPGRIVQRSLIQSSRASNFKMMFRPLTNRQCRISFAVACTVLLFGAACRRNIDHLSGLKIEHEITPQPARVGPARVTFTLADAAAKPIAGARVTVEADMSHAGMSPVFGEVEEIQPGRYQAELTFGMAGDWVILLHGTLPDGEKLERQFDVRDVRPN